MKLDCGWQLAYCTNIHRGEDWPRTFAALQRYTLAVRERVCPQRPYAIGLRLGADTARQLRDPATLREFQRWLEQHQCYVFTINGFPYGAFHGTRVKEQVYAPDWTSPERLEYTQLLFDLLAELAPPGMEGSVSTVPGSFKEFISSPEQVAAMRRNLWTCVDYIADLSRRTNKQFHLGLEPEPLCYLETSTETTEFFEQMRADRPGDDRLEAHLGVNYDTCHLAIEYEEPAAVLRRFQDHRVKVSKVHLSSALRVTPTPETRQALTAFTEPVYFHQVVERTPAGTLNRFRDLDVALAQRAELKEPETAATEWRIHFHVPLHNPPTKLFGTTADHLLGVLDLLTQSPGLCRHFEMETYTWEVLPSDLKQRDVVDQLAAEYDWTLKQLAARGVRPE